MKYTGHVFEVLVIIGITTVADGGGLQPVHQLRIGVRGTVNPPHNDTSDLLFRELVQLVHESARVEEALTLMKEVV